MQNPDDVMLKRRPAEDPLFPRDLKVPEGALVRKGLELPPVVPYVKFGKRIYGRHMAVEIGIRGTF